jgi:hypothetical protein
VSIYTASPEVHSSRRKRLMEKKKSLSREELMRLMPRDPLQAEENSRLVYKTLRLLAPVYGYHPAEVARISKTCGGRGLLERCKEDARVRHLIPSSLFIGGISGVSHTDLLCLKIQEQGFLKKFMGYAREYGDATFVFPVKGSRNPWVIHNLEVLPDKRRHCIMLYTTKDGGRHMQLIRIENFIKEFSNEQESDI